MLAEDTLTAWLATTPSDRIAAARLRYAVYVAEQGKRYACADHDKQLLQDEFDALSDIVLVADSDRVVGTVRSTSLEAADARDHWRCTFDLTGEGARYLQQSCVASRLAVRPEYRDRRVRDLLFRSIFLQARRLGTQHCFAGTTRPLAKVFRGYGFREFAPPFEDPVAGQLRRMVLVLNDYEHLRQVKSPFADCLNSPVKSAAPKETV